MQVVRARVLGFCMGVRRAVETALHVSEYSKSAFTLGPLIHNPTILKMLQDRGVVCLEENFQPGTIPMESKIIIRAHGISPAVEESLNDQGLRIIDATCPRVKASQDMVKMLSHKGNFIFLAGEENHAEIAGIKGCVESSACFVVANPNEARAAAADLLLSAPPKTALIGQTTISREEYNAIGKAILEYFPELKIFDTICSATSERQEALIELSEKVDAIIVAGGRDSANTRRLLNLAQNLGKPAWLIESSEDIPKEISRYSSVGLCAGASTPDNLIDEIERALTIHPLNVQ
ncbi:MAG: 4-hydroxy-3-methylbut-2-enyl diphosphate reductase [Treponema sp.]|nr:4-hydroxy-3-methylbut-2-enyl diphosphate reductase [Treponema sp.]